MSENLYLKIFKILTKKLFIVIFLFAVILLLLLVQNISYPHVIKAQVRFAPNNISTWIQNTGTFNQDIRTANTPGFEWPRGSNKTAIFTSGLSIAAYVNGELKLAISSFNGEYAPGFVVDSSGIPIYKTDSRFRLYSVRYGDNQYNNPDVVKWSDMIKFGAPFEDINNNKVYDIGIDRAGIPDASQTVFLCYTDADSSNHTSSAGFSGGTPPLFAEVHLTAWGYDFGPLSNVQYFKWTVINKNKYTWDKNYFMIFCDPDLGDASDDYIGCDTNLQLDYCYNATNQDAFYGQNPPAVGQSILRSAVNSNRDTLKVTSFDFMINTGSGGVTCEQDPSSSPLQAYNYMKGFKKDGTPWLDPTYNPSRITKFCYPGNPEDLSGWTEQRGRISNCGGSISGIVEASPPGNRFFMISSGSEYLTVNPGDTQKIVMAQMITQGNNNLNSVTKLKELTQLARKYYYIIEDETEIPYIEPPYIPKNYFLHQNFPNPFNPITTIKYEAKKLWKVKIQVYDMRGELISTLVNEEKPQGVYEVKFDASGLPSGVYFYKMTSSGGFEDSKKMVVIK